MVSSALTQILLFSCLVASAQAGGEPTCGESCKCQADRYLNQFCHGRCRSGGDIVAACLNDGKSCTSDDDCKSITRTRRRRLHTDDEVEWQSIAQLCDTYLYDGLLSVNGGHLFGIASPKQDAIDAGCPSFSFNAEFTDTSSAAHKALWIWNDDDEEVDPVSGSKEDAIHFGTFKFSEIVRAYEDADPNAAGVFKYDLVKNNCADLMLNVASNLGVKVDARVTKFVARRLLEQSGQKLVDSIRNLFDYKSYGSLFYGDDTTTVDVSGEELLERFVESQSKKLGPQDEI